MELKKLEDLINFLKWDSVESKKDVYLQIQTYLKRQSDRCISIENLVVIIKEDLKEKKFVSEALSTWILYTNCTKHSQEGLCEALQCNSGNLNEIIPILCKLINENLLDIENILSNTNFAWNKKVLDCIGNISKKVVFRIYLDFINIGIVDTIFRTKSSAIRDVLIDFVLLKNTFSIYHYTNAEQKHIVTRFKNNYIKKIDDLRVQNNKEWYKLCIFTMKYCGKLLHSEIELTNIILHYLEVGFKTKTVEDRLLSYDCWKVLIDICNLDTNYISNPKQLRLLIKPLKIKLSKNDEVVLKRFETWFYLATILQDKIVHCLEDLLKFCFEIQDSGITSEMSIDTNIIKDTWLKRVELLTSIIGHNEDDIHCLKTQHFNFAYPIVSNSNFSELDNVLLCSIHVACKIISKWESSTKKRMKIQCLWGSTFKIIRNLNDNIKENVLRKVSEILQLILQDCVTNNHYFEDIMMAIFSLLSSFKEPICNPFVLNEIIIFPIIRCMLSQQMLDPMWSEEVVNLVKNIPKEPNKQSYFNRISELLKTSSHVNNSFVVLFWLYIVQELYDICKMPREDFSEFKEHALFLLTWIFTWNNLEEILNLILPTWKRTFSEICTISNVFGEDILQNCEKMLKLQPQTGNNISTFLPDISQILFRNKIYKKNVTGSELLKVICQCSQNPNIRKAKVLLFIPILKKILFFCTGGDTTETTSIVLKIYDCIEYILKPHRIYEILELLKEIAPKLSSNVKKKLPNTLKAIIKDLAVSENNLSSKDAVYILSQFDEENNSQVFIRPMSSRSAKIANMAKDNAHSVLCKENKKAFSSEVKRSRKDNVGVTNLKLKRNAGNIDEENSGDFVLIPKEIMIDKSRLSNRQKEMMNKQNGDIPALYQDLSHSQSLDTNSNSLSENKIDLTLNDNFKDIITDMKKKNYILHENFETDLQSIFKNSNSQFNSNSSANLKDPTYKVAIENIPSHENILPKVDLSMKFEDSLKEDKCSIKTVGRVNNHGFKQECTNNTNLSDLPVKFEENTLTSAAVTLPTFSDHNLDNLSLLSDKKLKRKVRNKPLRSRRMSDSHIVLKRYNLDNDRYDFQDDRKLAKENEELETKESDVFSKYLKHKPKDLKSKIGDKDKSCLYKYNKIPLKQKYRSLDNLNDISQRLDVKKVKKCFKIIQNNTDVSNSIKLRISITDEDSYLEQDIIKQLDTEISKIDANLQSNSCLFSKNNSLVANSESIFGSLDILSNSEQPNLQDYDNQSKIVTEDESVSHNNEKNIAVSMTNSKIDLNDASSTKEIMSTMKNGEKEKSHLQRRKQRELDRIKMDIVGAEEFIITTPRRRQASKLIGSANKQTSSDNDISTLTPIERKTDKRKNSSYKNAEEVLSVNTEKSNIQGLINNPSNYIVTPKNSRKHLKPDSSNSQDGNIFIQDCNDITCDQDNKKVPSRTKGKSKSIRRTITLGIRTHPRRRIQKSKLEISEIETESLQTAAVFNSHLESNNADENLPKSGTSTVHLQKNTIVSNLKSQNQTENSQNTNRSVNTTNHYNLVESTEQIIDTYSEDGINQNTDAPNLENEVNFSTLGDVLNLKKLTASSETVSCSPVNDNSQNVAKIKTENSSTICSETDDIIGNFEKRIYNYDDNGIYDINEKKSILSKELYTNKDIQDVTPDVTAETSTNSTDCLVLPKVKSYERETFDEHETLTCNPYINIEKDKDFMEKFEKHGPGAVKILIKDLDFDDLPLAFETPKKESIPCSPVCEFTPDKNEELVKNTLDISPIKLELPESDLCEKNIAPVENKKTYIKKPSSRSAKLLNLLSSSNDLTPTKFLQAPKKVILYETSSPATQRAHKIISKCQMPTENPDATVHHDSVSIATFISEDQNILRFTRELPSPLATPNGSILKKRKFSDICDDNVPSDSKRTKRVNFSDPPTTRERIYFTENEEKSSDDMIDASVSFMSELNVTKASSICPKLSTCTMDINDIVTLLNRELVKHFQSVNIRTVGDLANLNENQVSQLEFLDEPRLKRIMEALDIISESYSCKEKDGFPICVDLVDCTHSLDKLAAIDSNFKKFRSSNIRSIGDLAKLTKPEVLQLSLKFSSVVQVLHKYNRRLNKKKLLTKQMQEELKNDADSAEQVEDDVLRNDSHASITNDLEKVPRETAPMTYKEVLRRSVDEELRYIKEQYNLDEIRNIFTHLEELVIAPK